MASVPYSSAPQVPRLARVLRLTGRERRTLPSPTATSTLAGAFAHLGHQPIGHVVPRRYLRDCREGKRAEQRHTRRDQRIPRRQIDRRQRWQQGGQRLCVIAPLHANCEPERQAVSCACIDFRRLPDAWR